MNDKQHDERVRRINLALYSPDPVTAIFLLIEAERLAQRDETVRALTSMGGVRDEVRSLGPNDMDAHQELDA